MRAWIFGTVAALTLNAASAPSPAADAPPAAGALAQLQGTWTAKAGPDRDVPVTLEIRDDRVTVRLTISAVGLEIRAEGTLKLDESVTPHRLDWVGFTAPNGESFPELLAIFELDGDTLRVCNGGPNATRPTDFEPGDGPLADVVVFHRERPATATHR